MVEVASGSLCMGMVGLILLLAGINYLKRGRGGHMSRWGCYMSVMGMSCISLAGLGFLSGIATALGEAIASINWVQLGYDVGYVMVAGSLIGITLLLVAAGSLLVVYLIKRYQEGGTDG